MSKNNTTVAAVATTIDFVAAEALAKTFDEKAASLRKERDELKEKDENKSHMKQQQMYKAQVEARHIRGAVSVTKTLIDKGLYDDLSEVEKAFLAEMRGEKKVAGGGINIFDDYFKGIDSGKVPLYCFLYMNADGSRLSPSTDQSKLMEGMMSGSIKERMNLNQLNKKLEELGLVSIYKVDGQFLVKGK